MPSFRVYILIARKMLPASLIRNILLTVVQPDMVGKSVNTSDKFH